MFEPQNAFEFAGYFLTDMISKMVEGHAPGKICFYGGEEDDTFAFTDKAVGKSYEDLVNMFIYEPPVDVIYGASIALAAGNDGSVSNLLVEVFDYMNPMRTKIAVPFQKKTFLKPFRIHDPVAFEVWGPMEDNMAFQDIAVFCLLQGAKEHPQFYPIWKGRYEGSKLSFVFERDDKPF